MLVMGISLDPPIVSQCPNGEDYSPCTCSGFVDRLPHYLTCKGTTLADVSRVFRQTTPADFMKFSLQTSITDPTEVIPIDLLNNHRAIKIEIKCSFNYSLRIDPQAFRSSKNMTRSVSFDLCDLSQLNFDFLSGFDRLDDIHFLRASNVELANWQSFPPLRNLNTIEIWDSTGLNEWTIFPKLFRGLSRLEFHDNRIQDEAMDRILNWTTKYSAETLEYLWISGNDMTNIPRQLGVASLFSKLQILYLDNQKTGIRSIPSGAFYGISLTSNLTANNNGIETIEEGAFQGNFKYPADCCCDN